jgi:hypothetical protein
MKSCHIFIRKLPILFSFASYYSVHQFNKRHYTNLDLLMLESSRGRLEANGAAFSHQLPIRAWEPSAGVQCLGSELLLLGLTGFPSLIG